MSIDTIEPRPAGRADRRTNRRRRVAVVACALGLLGAACSSSDSNDTATKDTTGDAVRQRELPPCPLDALTNYDASAGPIEVNLWHFFGAKPEEALKTLAANYNASQNKVKVNVENQGTSPDELWKKYTAGIKDNQLPDMAIMDDTVTVQMADSNTVLPAQSCINAGNVDMSDFVEPAQAYYRLGGDLYPASVNLSSALLYYNVNHFTRANLDPKAAPKTLAEVRDVAQKIKDAGVVDKPVVLKVGPPLIEMWLTGVGAPVVNNDNGRGTGTTDAGAFNSPEALELYTWFQDMQRDGLLQVVPDTEGQVGQYTSMATQQASMTIETSTAATSIVAFLGGDRSIVEGVDAPVVDVSQLDIAAAPVPGLRDPGRLQMGGGAWYMTTAGSPEKQAASWDFMQYVNSLDSQVTWSTIGSYLPYRISAASDPRLKANWDGTLSGSWLELAFDELNTGVDPDFPGPLMGPYDQFRVAVRSGVEDLLFKDAQPQGVIDATNDATTKALEQYQQENFG
jgi:sn-glycerol 3-phosphate transport system substrate-binding protein